MPPFSNLKRPRSLMGVMARGVIMTAEASLGNAWGGPWQHGPDLSQVVSHHSGLPGTRPVPGVLPFPELRRFYSESREVALMEPQNFVFSDFPELVLFIGFDMILAHRRF